LEKYEVFIVRKLKNAKTKFIPYH